MALPLETVVKQLEGSGIIAPGKLENFIPPKAAPKNAEELIRELFRQNHLTKFQAQQVALRKAQALILGEYTILDKIGAGGMGQVFKALHRRMDRTVAIKMLPPTMTKDSAAVARFEREVKAAAKLRHPNIVAADDAGQANGVHFLVMEYIEGTDLSALVKKHGPLDGSKALNYILQAAKGLEYAHKKGVVHRDIKPANLLLDTEGTVKILDMGLARIETGGDQATQAELTGTGAVMGTVDYMSPEQALSTKGVDARADIYSLGCTLYYLLAGKPLYDGETITAKLIAHQTNPIPALAEVQDGVPTEVQALFVRMVAKRVEDRYPSMTEVLADLEKIVAGQSTPSSLAPPAESTDTGLTKFFQQIPAQSTKRKAVQPATSFNGDPEGSASAPAKKLNPRLLLYGSIAAGAFSLLGIPLVLYFALVGGDKPPKKATLTVATTNPAGAASQLAAGQPINLFQHIDVAKGGEDRNGAAIWEQTGSRQTLNSLNGNLDRALPIDFTVPAAYILEATVSFRPLPDRPHRLNIGLRSGEHRFALQLDTSLANKPEIYSGLSQLDGKQAVQNETRFAGAVLTDGQPHTIRIEVRPDAIIAAVDGKQIVDFRGNQDRLSFPFPNKNDVNGVDISQSDLWLMVHDKTTFRSLTLTPLAATGGDYALEFAAGQQVTVPSLKLPKTGPVTIEGYFTLLGPVGDKGAALLAGAKMQLEMNVPGQLHPRAYAHPTEGEKILATQKGAMVIGERTHIACVWNAGELRLFVNGELRIRKLGTDAPLADPRFDFALGGDSWIGRIDEVRVSKVARYNADFKTLPTKHILDDDTLALYHFDEGTGNVLRDSSPNQHHGKITGATWVHANGTPITRANYALKLDRNATAKFGELFVASPDRFTVEAFVTPEKIVKYANVCLIGDLTGLRVDHLGEYWSLFLSEGKGAGIKPDQPAELGRRVHLAGVLDDTQLRLYVDGKLVKTQAFPGRLANREKFTKPAGISMFDGVVDEVRISSIARYQEDFLPVPRHEPDANTLALYHCDEGTGNVLRDSSPNQRHGQIVGAGWVIADGSALTPPPSPSPQPTPVKGEGAQQPAEK